MKTMRYGWVCKAVCAIGYSRVVAYQRVSCGCRICLGGSPAALCDLQRLCSLMDLHALSCLCVMQWLANGLYAKLPRRPDNLGDDTLAALASLQPNKRLLKEKVPNLSLLTITCSLLLSDLGAILRHYVWKVGPLIVLGCPSGWQKSSGASKGNHDCAPEGKGGSPEAQGCRGS